MTSRDDSVRDVGYGNLLTSSAYMLASSVAGGVLGYVYQILMGRFMTPEDYGLFMALMALVPLLSVPLATIYMSVSRRISQYLASGQSEYVRDFFWTATIKMILLGCVGLLAYIVLSVPLQRMLAAPSLLPVWLIGLYMFFVLLTPIVNAAVQANLRFGFIAFGNIFGPLAKLIFGMIFISLGWRVEGALYGLVATGALLAFIGFYYCWRYLGLGWRRPVWVRHLGMKDVYPVLLATLAFTLLFQVDVLLVKHLFSPHEAGIYAAAATLGKAVLFLPASIVVPLFPMTAAQSTAGRDTVGLLYRALAVTVILTLAAATFYFIFGEWLVQLLFGERYAAAGSILRLYGVAMIPMAIILVIENYLVAKGRLLFAYMIFGFSPIFVAGAFLWHDALVNIVWLMIATGAVCLGVAAIVLGGARKVGQA